jgi:hypothetical protein
MNNNPTAQAKRNSRTLATVCQSAGLVRKATADRYRYVICDAAHKSIGVVDCYPSNNGKYQAYRFNVPYVDVPLFGSFAAAVSHVTQRI